MRFRPALTSDAPAVAALHADSWRRYYRGAYADAYLDGDIDADRLAVWSTRLAEVDPRRVTIVAEAEPVAQASGDLAPASAERVTIEAGTDAVASADGSLPESDSGRVVMGPADLVEPAAGGSSLPGVVGAGVVAVADARLPQAGSGRVVVGDSDLVAGRLARSCGNRAAGGDLAAPADHRLPLAGDGGVPTANENPRGVAAGDHHLPPAGIGGLTRSSYDRLVADTGGPAWRIGAADESDTRHLPAAASALVGFVHLVVDDDPRWGSLIDNLHVATDRHRGGVGSGLIMRAAAAAAERGATPALYLWVQEQNTAAQAFYAAHGGRVVERALISAPGGIPGRLNGHPRKLRVAWPDAEAFVRPR